MRFSSFRRGPAEGTFLVVVLILLGAGLAVLLREVLHHPFRQRIALPGYFPASLAPGRPDDWAKLTRSSAAVAIVVANVLNGPGNRRSAGFARRLAVVRKAGIDVLGYVDTGYVGTTGHRTRAGETSVEAWLDQIRRDIDAWYAFYGVSIDGIFFDQVTAGCGDAKVYQSLSQRVTTSHAGAVTAINPGTAVPRCYENAASILLTFEGSYRCYVNDPSCPSGLAYAALAWKPADPTRIWHLVYDTREAQLSDVIRRSRARRADYVYVTDDVLPNPWDTLPEDTYWSHEQAEILGS